MRDQKALAEYLRRRSPLTSIVSYPDRGPWGDNRYPGNSSGYLLIDLCATYAPRAVLDPMEGGGTSRDVCADMGIGYQGFDLHSGVDSLHDEIGSDGQRPPTTRAKLLSQLLKRLDRSGGQNQLRAAYGAAPRDLLAETARCAGDHNHFVA